MVSRTSLKSCVCQSVLFIFLSLVITVGLYHYAARSMDQAIKVETYSPPSYSGAFKNPSGSSLYDFHNRMIGMITNSSLDIGPIKKVTDIVESIRIKSPHSDSLTAKEDSHGNSSDRLIDDIRILLVEIQNFLSWVSNLTEAESKNVLNWSRLANNEIHYMKLLSNFFPLLLNKHERGDVFGYSNVFEFARGGYQCSNVDMLRQQAISKKISMDICSEIEWYKLIQLCLPDSSIFVDVGANKGYLGSLFVSLWGMNAYGVTPAAIFDVATKTKVWETSRNPAGYCRDGYSHGIGLRCKNGRSRVSGQCLDTKPPQDLKVYSIDGSSYLAETLNGIIQTAFPNSAVKSGQVWKYFNFAVSDKSGVVQFTKQTRSSNPGFEGGRIRGATQSAQTEAVNMTTIDEFLVLVGQKGLDLLKIDTEGNDNKVIVGASYAIRRDAKVFTFEGGSGVTLSKDMLQQFDELGFSCYSTSRAGLFKWNSGCLPDKMMGSFAAKDKGNVFCASRHRAPLLTMAMDALSFPMLLKTIALSEQENSEDISKLSAAFLNIKPYCHPWPKCVGEIKQI